MVPLASLLMLLAKGVVPPTLVPVSTACEVSTGTWSPTFIVAGTLSVAIMLGAAITRVRLVFSWAFKRASSSWLFNTSAPVVSVSPPAAVAEALRTVDAPDGAGAFRFCKYEFTPALQAPVRSTS